MKRISAVGFLLIFLLGAPSSAAVREVLARACDDWLWIARVTQRQTATGPIDQTRIIARHSGPGEQWKTLAEIPARATALSCRSSQLVVLFSDGEWKLVWGPSGASSGNPLPAGSEIRALASDGDTLWAVGAVRGGLAAVAQLPTTAPAAPGASPAAFAPGRLPHIEPTTAAVVIPKLVLFRQDAGVWTALTEVPPDAMFPPIALMPADSSAEHATDISLAIVAGRPWVSLALTNGSVRTLRFTAEHAWEELGSPEPGKKVVDFTLLSVGSKAFLVTTDAAFSSRLYFDAATQRTPVTLKWPGTNPPDGLPAIASLGGYLRLIAPSGGKLFEQRYELDGTPVGSPAQLDLYSQVSETELEFWANTTLVVALAFSVGATLYRRSVLRKKGGEITAPPAPAPLFPRFAAGALDLLPVLVTLSFLIFRGELSQGFAQDFLSKKALFALASAVAIYLIHTSLCETFTGRSVGKWIFGLKVVSLDGSKPDGFQLIVRNLLRVIDLLGFPLMLVVISPLRQRSADIAAGTMVVRLTDQPDPAPDSEDHS